MKINLHEGKVGEIEVEIPVENLYFVADRGKLPAAGEWEIKRALAKPIGMPPLSDLVTSRDRVLLVVDDVTRPTPQDKILPVLLDELNRIGVPDGSVEAVIGLGTHRYMTEAEIEKKYGGEALDRIPILNHDYKDPRQLTDLGMTPSGILVTVNKKLLEVDFVVAIGNIVPHIMAGWGGGGKSIQPGVSGEETTAATHFMAAKMEAVTLLSGNLDQQVRREIDAIASEAGLSFIVNTVLNREDKISQVFAGDPVKAHRAGVVYAAQAYRPEIPGRADVVVVSCHPADLDFWQGIKPLSYAFRAVKPGGTIILVAEFPDGVSPTHPSAKEMGLWTRRELLRTVEKGEAEDVVAVAAILTYSTIRDNSKIICVSQGMKEEEKEALGMGSASTVDEALEEAFRQEGRDAKVGVLKCGEILPNAV